MNERLATIYPDGKKAVYSYDGAGRLAGLETARGMVSYSYDSLGRLASKKLPNEAVTEYLYNEIGRLSEISHKGADFTESYVYEYDEVGNKISADKHRAGSREDSGKYSYSYDELNRLTEVSKDGSILRKYGYDAFGNRSYKEDYKNSVSGISTTYSYNDNNQLIARVTDGMEESYSYDKRGNLVSVANGTDVIKTFVFDAANRMTESVSYAGSEEKKASYSYNGFGQRIGQSITVTDPEKDVMNEITKQINYTLDLTKQYHNLLTMEENSVVKDFYWDTNVVSMNEAGIESYYIQDDLGSPMGIIDELGGISATYAFDEFGENLFEDEIDEHEKSLQPFGYTGYQMDEVSGLYFAQARRYDSGNGRFVSEDLHKGFKAEPYTLNKYIYCWNRPMDYVDNNGKIPWVVIPLVILVGLGLTGCSGEEEQWVMPEPTGYEFKHKESEYNSDTYCEYTNCYAFAFDMVVDPITGKKFYKEDDGMGTWAAQPGNFSGVEYDSDLGESGTDEGDAHLVAVITADANAMGLEFIPQKDYDESMTGGYWVLLAVSPGTDYHWYRQNPDGSWSHKPGPEMAMYGVEDPVLAAKNNLPIAYPHIVGYFYIVEEGICEKE